VKAESSLMKKNRQNSTARNWFETKEILSELKNITAHGAVVTIIGQAAKLLLTMLSTFILARLLTPEDYGLVAMVATFLIFASLFKDIGLSMATVQYETINHEQISALFWINTAISVSLSLLLCAVSPLISWFYSEPRLLPITIAGSLSFIFSGLGIQHSALLRRKMLFTILTRIEIFSMVTGVAISIFIALLSHSYWALVISELTSGCISCLLVWRATDWRPGKPQRTKEIKGMLRFGRGLTGFNIINYFARNADNVLIGYFCGASSLGLYNKAYNLLMLPLSQINTPLSNVAIPALSRLQKDPQKYSDAYYSALNIVAYLTLPLMGFLIITAEELIVVLLGEQWRDSAAIFRMLGVAGLVQPLGNTVGWVYTSLGQTDRMFRWGMLSSPLMVLSFLVGIHWGALGVATCYTVVVYLLAGPMFWYAYRFSPINCRRAAVSVIRPAELTFLVILTGCLLNSLRLAPTLLLDLVNHSAAAAITVGICFFLLPGMKIEIMGAWRVAHDGFKDRRKI